MSYSRYDDAERERDRDWERRFARSLRGREGFAWGAFFVGFVLGAIIF